MAGGPAVRLVATMSTFFVLHPLMASTRVPGVVFWLPTRIKAMKHLVAALVTAAFTTVALAQGTTPVAPAANPPAATAPTATPATPAKAEPKKAKKKKAKKSTATPMTPASTPTK